jgi:hypothetical protein
VVHLFVASQWMVRQRPLLLCVSLYTLWTNRTSLLEKTTSAKWRCSIDWSDRLLRGIPVSSSVTHSEAATWRPCIGECADRMLLSQRSPVDSLYHVSLQQLC